MLSDTASMRACTVPHVSAEVDWAAECILPADIVTLGEVHKRKLRERSLVGGEGAVTFLRE